MALRYSFSSYILCKRWEDACSIRARSYSSLGEAYVKDRERVQGCQGLKKSLHQKNMCFTVLLKPLMGCNQVKAFVINSSIEVSNLLHSFPRKMFCYFSLWSIRG